MTAVRPLMYVESVPDGPHGPLTIKHLQRALGERINEYEIVLAEVAAPDLARLEDASIFVSTRFDTQRMRQHARSLQFVHLLNAGVERYMPLDWLPPRAILTNSSGIHADMVAEYGVMALLMLNHHLHRYIAFQHLHLWKKLAARPIRGKRVLIVGTGSLGSAIAGQARALGMQVSGVSRSGAHHEAFDDVVSMAHLDDALPLADFIVLACPLTALTRYMFNAARFALCRPDAGLINVGRGALVDTTSLADALRSGQLAGAILDVQETEPIPPDSTWWDVEHLVLTPHISCDTDQDYLDRGLDIFARNLHNFGQGHPMENVVDAEQGY